MPKFIVFQDSLKGMICLPPMESDTLEEAINYIHEGVVGMRTPSQMYMYYIYQIHTNQMLYLNNRVDVYRYVKSVAGSQVEPIFINHKTGLQYAIDIGIDDYDWIFADNIFKT